MISEKTLAEWSERAIVYGWRGASEARDAVLGLVDEVRQLRKSRTLLLDALEYMETYWPEQKAEAMRWAEARDGGPTP